MLCLALDLDALDLDALDLDDAVARDGVLDGTLPYLSADADATVVAGT